MFSSTYLGSLTRRLRNHMSTTASCHWAVQQTPFVRVKFSSTHAPFRTMEKLEALPSISRLSKNVVRVLGQNPGKFTLQGTNTYIIGEENPYTLIDTGEGREEYTSLLEIALREAIKVTNEPDISDIIISHWHPDHVGGLLSVLDLLRKLWEERNTSHPFKPPRLHKFPLQTNTPTTALNLLPSIISSLTPNSCTPSPQGHPFHDLHDSQTITSSSLRILHTPGHTTDSICLYIPQTRALYTADTVLGQGTAVFEDLSAYLSSLNKMLHFGESELDGGYISLYPGHGPVVSNGKETINEYIKHRLEREAQILKLLKSPPPEGAETPDPQPRYWTTWTIVTVLYAAYPESLWLPAARSIDLHLRKLQTDGVVRLVAGEFPHTSWEILKTSPSPPVEKSSY